MLQSQIIFWRSDDAQNSPIEFLFNAFLAHHRYDKRGGECDDNYRLGVEQRQRLLGI